MRLFKDILLAIGMVSVDILLPRTDCLQAANNFNPTGVEALDACVVSPISIS
jgi:hypothetical protein